MFDIPSLENVSEVIVDVSSVKEKLSQLLFIQRINKIKINLKPQLRNIALNKR